MSVLYYSILLILSYIIEIQCYVCICVMMNCRWYTATIWAVHCVLRIHTHNKGHISKWKFSQSWVTSAGTAPTKITPCSWLCSEQLYRFGQFKLVDLHESHLLNWKLPAPVPLFISLSFTSLLPLERLTHPVVYTCILTVPWHWERPPPLPPPVQMLSSFGGDW